MQLLTDDQAIEWARQRGVSGYNGGSNMPKRVRLSTPVAALEIAGLAYRLAITDVPAYDEERFAGALVWLRRWEIWSESIDGQGYVLLNSLRFTSERRDTLDVAPASAFAPGEFMKAAACLVLPMIFQWDAEFISAEGGFQAFVSHDGYVDVKIGNPEHVAEVLARFQQYRPVDLSAER